MPDNLVRMPWTEGVNEVRKLKHVGIKCKYVRDSFHSNICKIKLGDNRYEYLG